MSKATKEETTLRCQTCLELVREGEFRIFMMHKEPGLSLDASNWYGCLGKEYPNGNNHSYFLVESYPSRTS